MEKQESTFKCAECAGTFPSLHESGHFGNYGTFADGKIVCLECCAVLDRRALLERRQFGAYLSKETDGSFSVSNWPGTLRLPCSAYPKKCGGFCWGKTRWHVHFRADGHDYYVTGPGPGLYLGKIRRLKARSARK